jgi:predicted dehydrogenase
VLDILYQGKKYLPNSLRLAICNFPPFFSSAFVSEGGALAYFSSVMNNKHPRIAVVGVGRLGSIHARLWSVGGAGAQLAVLYDVDIERSKAVAEDIASVGVSGGASSEAPRVAYSLDEALAEADAVTIASPSSTHYEIALRALRAGKHCFIEKPAATSAAECAALEAEARARGLTVHIGHVERFNPALLHIQPYSCKPLFIEAHRLAQFKPRALDVSVILDLMIHDIDLALWLARSPVVEIRANGVAVLTAEPDIANARLQFENGCVANLTASRISANTMRKMRIFEPNAYRSLDFASGVAEIFHVTGDEEPPRNALGKVAPAVMLGAIEAGEKKRSLWYERREKQEINAIVEEQRAFLAALPSGESEKESARKNSDDGSHGDEPQGITRATTLAEASQALAVAEEIAKIIASVGRADLLKGL